LLPPPPLLLLLLLLLLLPELSGPADCGRWGLLTVASAAACWAMAAYAAAC